VFDLGDTWTLTATARLADVATDASAVVLTVTLPDGTTATPSTTDTGTGTYSATYTPATAGRYTARWLFTFAGGATDAYTDELNVRPSATGALFSLAEAKAHLNITTTTDDEELRSWIGATTRVVENKVGPCARQTVSQRVGNGPVWWLRRYPVLSLTSVTAALTGGTAVTTAELAFDADTGRVERLDGLALAGGPWTIAYVAGRAVLPENVESAAKIILKHLWETQRGGTAGFAMGPDDVMVPGFPWAVPKRAVELLEADLQIWGYA
jgi:hypothetical protein